MVFFPVLFIAAGSRSLGGAVEVVIAALPAFSFAARRRLVISAEAKCTSFSESIGLLSPSPLKDSIRYINRELGLGPRCVVRLAAWY